MVANSIATIVAKTSSAMAGLMDACRVRWHLRQIAEAAIKFLVIRTLNQCTV
jgi:hypothetical protein